MNHHTHQPLGRPRRRTAAILTALALTGAPTLAACGSDDDAEPAGTVQTAANGDVFNTADVEFAQQMIPHHAQATEMADMVRGRDVSPTVEQLAAQIFEAQTPEVELMVDWLTAWDEDIPATMRDHANAEGDTGHDMAGMDDESDAENPMAGMDDMPGMMSTDEMDALEAAPDSEFEQMWLEMMIEHHEGAIEMAQDEQADGEFGPAVDLAKSIETSQQAEVDEMTELLGS